MGFAAPNPIEWADIEAFSRQTRTRLLPWEIEIIESVDDAFLQPATRQAPASQSQGKDKIVASVDVSDGRGIRALLRSIAGRGKKKGG